MKVISFQITGCGTLSELFSRLIREMPVSAFIRYKVIDIKMGPFLQLIVVSVTRKEVRCTLRNSDKYLLSGEEDQTILSSKGKLYLLEYFSAHFPKQSYSCFFNAPILLSRFHSSWQHGCSSHVDLFRFIDRLCLCSLSTFPLLKLSLVPFAQPVLACCVLLLRCLFSLLVHLTSLLFSASSISSPCLLQLY